MGAHKKFIVSWIAGGLLLLAVFYAAMSWLWSAARSSAAASLESQVSSVLVSDLAEGNLFKLGATLSRLMNSGALEYAEIRSYSPGTGWERLYRTRSAWSDTSGAFSGFSCGSPRQIIPHRGEGVSLVTTLPSNIEGAECVALFLSSDLPAELKTFKNRLAVSLGLLLAGLLAGFLWLTISWHKKNLRLEVAARTAQAEKEAAIGRMAAQVAHDIRSPLAALTSVLKDLSLLPPEARAVASGALGRIGEIARNLLEDYRRAGQGSGPAAGTASPQYLKKLIAQVLDEKRAQYASRAGLIIKLSALEDVCAVVEPAGFRRVISNLLNNAVEALDGGGLVTVELSSAAGKALLRVADNGKGIPAGLLEKLGRKGETHGKTGGTGLGLYHARETVLSWGGNLKIGSEPGAGTEVLIELPARPLNRVAVLLDDDELVRMNWRLAAKAAGVELKVCGVAEEFFAAVDGLPGDTPLYIDSELGNGMKGEEIAGALMKKGFTCLTLATGRAPEEFVQRPWLRVAGKEPPWG